jgi:hypothetical protein
LEQPKKSKHSLLPVLVVLFLISYALMTLLIIEQGTTISAQRWLIKELFVDSSQLTAMKGKAIQEHNAEAQAKAKAEAQSKSQTHAPSVQVPSEDRAKTESKMHRSSPQHPPKPATDAMDVRRTVVTI